MFSALTVIRRGLHLEGRVGVPSGADVGDEIAKKPFVILFDIYAALLLGSIQGVGNALFIIVILQYLGDGQVSSRTHTSICSGFL